MKSPAPAEIIDAEALFSGTKQVDPRYRLDETALSAWLSANVEGYSGPLLIQQFKGGQSNPTYQLETPQKRYVLRRKPPGELLPSAHAVDREYRVISRLHAAGFAVPDALGLCEDTSVIGSMFYVMSMEEGRVLWDGALPQIDKPDRRAIYATQIETLAQLHSFSPAAVGLEDFGKPGNYCARQIDRWIRQYRASETKTIDAMERLIDWLPDTVPEQTSVAIVHGDYRLNNMIFDNERPVVKAVLDWELATLGDPVADFANLLISWALPYDGRALLGGLDLPELGIPTMEEAVTIYFDAAGRKAPATLDWYLSYNLFRLAAIMQGIAGRVRDGTANSPRAKIEGETATPLAEAAWTFAKRAGA